MEIKKYIFLLAVIISSCSNGYKTKPCVNVKTDSAEILKHVYEPLPNQDEYTEYQTFDEFSMKPIGRKKNNPYVLVCQKDSFIYVKSSVEDDSIRVYKKLRNGLWHSHMEYENWKRHGYKIIKQPWERMARTYDRYFYNDSILEVETDYDEDRIIRRYFVKTRKRMWILSISNLEEKKIKDIAKLRKMFFAIIQNIHSDKGYFKVNAYSVKYSMYTLNVADGQYVYRNKYDDYKFLKKGYGFWGIQPGIDERRLVDGREIDAFSSRNPHGIVSNDCDYIFDDADIYPSYPGGESELKKYLMSFGFKMNELTPRRYVVGFIVEKNGTITNIRLAKGNPNMAGKIKKCIKGMPRWIPGSIGGVNVRMRVAILFTDNQKQ